VNSQHSICISEPGSTAKPESASAFISVFIVENSRMGCQLMVAALRRGRCRVSVSGFATETSEALSFLKNNVADITIISCQLREGVTSGLTLTRAITASRLNTRVLMVLDSTEAPIVVEAFRAGAKGIFSREEPFDLMCKCIHVVHQGQIWANSKAMNFAIEALAQAPDVQPLLRRGQLLLTRKEKLVADLVVEGLTNRDISNHLNLSEHTVRNYLFRIFNKVGASSRLELALHIMSRRQSNESSSQA
jgi:two-component system nitrate/nitrite response regulator NarL